VGMSIAKRIRLLFRYFKKEDKGMRDFAIGMNSEVDIRRDLHILFLDYDQVELQDVEESVGECQRFWHLSDCFLYKTRNGFHAYFFYDIMPYTRVRMIIDYAKYVDDMFKFIGRYYDYKTIRQCGKYKQRDIQFVKVVKGSRLPTEYELEIGEMKRKERIYIADMGDMLNKGGLKE